MTVSLRVDNVIASAVSANVSKGGLQLRTMSPLSVGRRLKVRFRLPGGTREIEAEATVAWSDARSGMGVQFNRLDPKAQTELDEFRRIAASSRIEKRRRQAGGSRPPGA